MPAGATYVALASTSLSSTSSAISFTSISQAYTDLVIVASMRLSAGSTGHLCFNATSPSGTSYEILYFSGNGSAFQSKDIANGASVRLGEVYGSGINSTNFTVMIASIGDYAATNKFKSVIVNYAEVADEISLTGGTWHDTSAITSIGITSGSTGHFVTGCSFSIYGIARA